MLQQMVAMPDQKKIRDVSDNGTSGQENISAHDGPVHVRLSPDTASPQGAAATIRVLASHAEIALAVARQEYLLALRLPELTLRERIRKASVLSRVSRRMEACDLALALVRRQVQAV